MILYYIILYYIILYYIILYYIFANFHNSPLQGTVGGNKELDTGISMSLWFWMQVYQINSSTNMNTVDSLRVDAGSIAASRPKMVKYSLNIMDVFQSTNFYFH